VADRHRLLESPLASWPPAGLFRLLPLTLGLFWIILLARIVHLHPPADDRALWRTRPLNGAAVGGAKLLLAVVLLIALPLLPAFVTYMQLQTPWALLLQRFGAFGFTATFLLLGPLFVASLCRTSARFFSVLAGLSVLLLVTIALSIRTNHQEVSEAHLAEGTAALIVVAGAMGFGTLFIRQYQQTHTGAHLCLGLGVLVALGGIGRLGLNGLSAVPLIDPEVKLQVINPRITAEVSAAAPTFTFKGHISVEALPEDSLWQAHIAQAHVESQPEPLRGQTAALREGPLQGVSAIARLLNLSAIRDERLPVPTAIRLSGPNPATAQLDGPADVPIDLQVRWTRFQVARLSSLPLQSGAHYRSRGVHVELMRPLTFSPTLNVRVVRATKDGAEIIPVLVSAAGEGVILQTGNLQRSAGPLFEMAKVEYLLPENFSLNGARLELIELTRSADGRWPIRTTAAYVR
jgi:hypothetical protein